MNRIRQLDSLRALAVILVILHHTPVAFNELFLNEHPLGANLFMVLSGYLITSILLHEQQKAQELGIPKTAVFRNFIVKRALRIFPLYFLFLVVVALHGTIKPSFLLALSTFTANFYIFWKKDWMHLSHTWSLSVQEHFYFFWPLVLLFSPRRWVMPLILLFILVGVVCQQFVFPGEFGALLTPSCFDALGGGALLAWLLANKRLNQDRVFRWLGVAAAVCLAVIVVSMTMKQPLILPFRTLYTVPVMWLIAYIVYWGDRGLLNKPFLLANPVLQFLGRISFGLYLLHPVLPDFTGPFFMRLNHHLPAFMVGKWLPVLENNLVLVPVSYLSYRFIEMPFLSMEKYFIIPSKTEAGPVGVVAGAEPRETKVGLPS